MNKTEELKQNLDVLYEGERTPWKNREILNQLQQYATEVNQEQLKELKSYADIMSDMSSKTFLYRKILELTNQEEQK